jgi:hypothetical protein
MKTNLKKASLLLTGVMIGSKLFAQSTDTSATAKDYVRPFSGGGELRTWSIGVHGGLLTPFTIFDAITGRILPAQPNSLVMADTLKNKYCHPWAYRPTSFAVN